MIFFNTMLETFGHLRRPLGRMLLQPLLTVLLLTGLLEGSCVLSKLLTRSRLSSCLAVTDDDNDEDVGGGGVTLLVSRDGLSG